MALNLEQVKTDTLAYIARHNVSQSYVADLIGMDRVNFSKFLGHSQRGMYSTHFINLLNLLYYD